MTRSFVRPLIAVAVALVAGGCGDTLVIESDTTWKGTMTEGIMTTPIEGTGNAKIDAPDETFCWTIAKQTSEGRLRAYLRGGFPNIIATKDGDKTTHAPFGVVTGCT